MGLSRRPYPASGTLPGFWIKRGPATYTFHRPQVDATIGVLLVDHGAASRGLGQRITAREGLSRNIESLGQWSNHFERQWPRSIEYFGHTYAQSNAGLEVLSRQRAGPWT